MDLKLMNILLGLSLISVRFSIQECDMVGCKRLNWGEEQSLLYD